MTPTDIDITAILSARKRIEGIITKTPLEYSSWFSSRVGGEVFLKLENEQVTHSFKIRGALNRLILLPDDERKHGIVAASAGNHAQGVAYAASVLGIDATIVVPTTAPKTKCMAIRSYGIEPVIHGEDLFAAQERARAIRDAEGRTLISAYNHPDIIAGQGTVGLEIAQELPDVSCVLVPVGGGGLIAGIGTAVSVLHPQTDVIGVQSTAATDAATAWKSGAPSSGQTTTTLADGIRVRLEPDAVTIPIMQSVVDDFLLVDDNAIRQAVRELIDAHHLIAEGAGAAGLAALMTHPERFRGMRTVVVISGGNIDTEQLVRILTGNVPTQ